MLTPLARSDTRTVRMLGLNYAKHAKESNLPIPTYPVLFYKPVTSLAGPFSPIPVHPIAQEAPASIDYECELVAVIGKEVRDVSEENALDYVLGYAVGNDVSHREWQLKRGGGTSLSPCPPFLAHPLFFFLSPKSFTYVFSGQWSLGKHFDAWSPFGPGIVSTSLVRNPQKLKISTKVNGETVQSGETSDMIFSIAKTIAFLSQGNTLLPGDLIWTGTPAGVGMGRNPQVWLKDGDVVEVALEGVGSCTNKVEFDKGPRAKL